MDAEVGKRRSAIARGLASASFLVLVVALTYFAILFFRVHFGDEAHRAAAYTELGRFLSGRLDWYQDARVYGALSLLLGVVSLLFGVHPLAKITIPTAGTIYLVLQFAGDRIREAIHHWSQTGG